MYVWFVCLLEFHLDCCCYCCCFLVAIIDLIDWIFLFLLFFFCCCWCCLLTYIRIFWSISKKCWFSNFKINIFSFNYFRPYPASSCWRLFSSITNYLWVSSFWFLILSLVSLTYRWVNPPERNQINLEVREEKERMFIWKTEHPYNQANLMKDHPLCIDAHIRWWWRDCSLMFK